MLIRGKENFLSLSTTILTGGLNDGNDYQVGDQLLGDAPSVSQEESLTGIVHLGVAGRRLYAQAAAGVLLGGRVYAQTSENLA